SRDGHRLEVGHVNLTHASGAISQCSGVWGPPSLTFSTEYAVTGDVGTLRHSSLDGGGGGAGLEDDSFDVLDPYGPYTAQLREFFAAMTGGPAPRVSVEDGVEAVRIAEAALESVATGAPVSLVPAA
ncbi:MAG: Gfo/Idh/MocA family oxidoreductase, partial [Acidipropionibacterium jensenii]|nr:Gfo/Idh/MocA family oxidoreductase [Acidipropionibacterium jensenii]